jgi:hypothetical protein
MAITTLDTLIAGFKPPMSFWKASQTAEGAGTWHSLWKAAGNPTAGATPAAYSAGSGYTPDESTQGALPFTDPVSGNSYLTKFAATGASICTLILYDRVWHCSGFATNSVATQSITTPGTMATGRDANGATLGAGVELWGEVYTAPGATGATWTVSYTNQAGTAAQSATYTHPANAESVGQMFPFTLASGDTGVRAVASLTCSISSGTAGDIGITLLRRVAEIPITLINSGILVDGLAMGLPRLYDSSCLALMVSCSGISTGLLSGSYGYAQG